MVLLLFLFMAAVMLMAAAAAVPRLITQGRRQREEELAWRGEQYVRAIRLYYRRLGQFPKTLEDLSKNPANMHFLRKQYKDPLNSTDGSWRYIYISPTGQLMGSLTRTLPIGIVPLGGPGAPGTSAFGSGPTAPGGFSLGPAGAAGSAGASTPQPSGGATPSSSSGSSGLSPLDTSGAIGMPDDFGSVSGLTPGTVQPPKKAIEGAQTIDSPVIGGQLVGIGSKVDRKSIRFYKGYGKYREWEFIWDPAQEAAAAGVLPGGGVLPAGIGPPPTGTPATGTQPPGNPPPPGTPQQPQP